ncbi:MAG: hypothetical protein M1830_010664 [Pleopsidium flavum]|nr:MAG: hypothetical protein M1830_010674 [Pleopsidium flavum]KAI9873738.1 MAG: hypothetical protein M1830_010664 [Pleopsidium flavum]
MTTDSSPAPINPLPEEAESFNFGKSHHRRKDYERARRRIRSGQLTSLHRGR